MKAFSIVAALCAALVLPIAQAAPTADVQAQVDRAASALGVLPSQALRIAGTITYYDPEQSRVPGGEPRLGTEATFVQWRDVAGTRSRIEWRMDALRPYPKKLQFVEVVEGGRGYVMGTDSMLPVKENLPGGHLMSRTRVAANERELLRTAPDLLLRMQREPARLQAIVSPTAAGERTPTVRFAVGATDLQVGFDAASGLPSVIRMRDHDPIMADSDFDLVLSDWRDVGGWRHPFQQRYELNGKVVASVRLTSVQSLQAPADAWSHPNIADEPAGSVQTDSFQWFLRKQGFAVLLDTDAIYFDPQQSRGLAFRPLAPSVWLATGGFYNSLVVVLGDALVVYDAPHETHAQALLQELAQHFPGKRVSHLILTHHHMDHAGGLRSYVVAGATLVVGAGLKQHFTDALRRPNTLGLPALRTPEALRALAAPQIVEVRGEFSVGEGSVQARAYPVLENEHAEGMLFGYVPQARLGFVSDIWSPGRSAPLPPAGTEQGENLRALARSVAHWKLDPDRFAGGHGTVGAYAPVGALLH
jgi:glyoxylase-like metal-dependent hydrolase (beta-lactamase superfamily II)